MEMINFRSRSGGNTDVPYSANVREKDDMDRYSPTSPTENSPVHSPLPDRSRTPNRYSPTNPTDDVDDLEDHIFRTERTGIEEYSVPADTVHAADSVAKEGAYRGVGNESSNSHNDDDDDSDCDSENRLVIEEEVEEEKEGTNTEPEEEREDRQQCNSYRHSESVHADGEEPARSPEQPGLQTVSSDIHQTEGEPQKEDTLKYEDDPMSIVNLDSIPLPASEPEDKNRGAASDVLQLSADNDLETRPNDVDSRKQCSDDSSSDESEDSRQKNKEPSSSSSSSSSTSSSDRSPEYEQSPDTLSSPEHQSRSAAAEDKSQDESDKESSGELLDEDNSIDGEGFRREKEASDKGRKSGAGSNREDSQSQCIEDEIDIIEMSVDLDDKDYASEPRLMGFSAAPRGSPALGVTRVIQRVSVEPTEGDSRTVQAGEDSDDDVQIIECPPQEPIDTLIVDDDEDDDVVPCGGDSRKTLSEAPRSHRSKKKRTVEQDGHDLRIVIREERRDRDDQDRNRRRRDKGSHSRREERKSDSHKRDESNHHSSEYSSRRRHHRSQSRSRERRRSRKSRSRSRSQDRSSRRRRHRERSREHERSSERERERDREKSHRKKRHDHKHEQSHKSRSRSRSRRHHRGDSWDKENEDHSNREHTSYRQYKNRHYRHHEESAPEESPVVENRERKRKKRKRERGESSTHERRRRRREDEVGDHSHGAHGESPVLDRRHQKHVEDREESPVTDRRRRRHAEREELALMEGNSRHRRHVEQREESPQVEKRRRRRMKEQESSPYIERRSGRHTEEHLESPVMHRKSRRHMEEYEETFPDERRSRNRRQREEHEESFNVERSRRSRRHTEEQIESPVVERRSRRHAEEREEFAQVERKRRKHVEILADSSLPERRNRSRKHADEWEEPLTDDRSSRRHMEELHESPVIERKRTQSSTWSPSDTFQKDPSDSSDSDSSSSQESDERSEDDSEEEEVERQVVLVNREEEEEPIESSDKEDEDVLTDDDLLTSKPDSLPIPDSDDVSVQEADDDDDDDDDASVQEVEHVSSPESEPSEKETGQPSASEDEPEESVPVTEDLPLVLAHKSEDSASNAEAKEAARSPPPCQDATPEEAVYDPAHPTESETDKGLFPGSPKAPSVHEDKVNGTHSPKKPSADEAAVSQPSVNSSSSDAVPTKESVKADVVGAHHHLMASSALVRPPFGRTLPRPLAAPPLPPGFRLQIGGPDGPITIKSQAGQLLPPGPPPLPRNLSDLPNSRAEGDLHSSVSQFSTGSASEMTNNVAPMPPSGLHTMFQSSKEGKVSVDKFDNTLANLVVAQNLLSAMKEGSIGGQSSVVAPPKPVFRVSQPPVPPPPKVPMKLPPSSTSAQSLSGDSREVMDMDMSPLDDECELELPTPPDLSSDPRDKQKMTKPPLPPVSLKALTSVIKKLTSQPADDMPASAVDLTNKEKYLKKLHLQERVVDEVKQALRPFYSHKKITKEEYKGILRKAVPKICHSKSGNINPQKILQLVEGYVAKFQKQRHHSGKKDKSAKAPKERVKANGERVKATR